MISAFGIDHGEISKGRFFARAPKPPVPKKKPVVRPARGQPGGKKPTKEQVRTQGTKPNQKSRPAKIKSAAHKVGEADVSLKGVGGVAGRGAQGVGGFFERHPGLTGTALIGGGGAAGYHFLSQREPRKKGT